MLLTLSRVVRGAVQKPRTSEVCVRDDVMSQITEATSGSDAHLCKCPGLT
jgi:hypothetical protein